MGAEGEIAAGGLVGPVPPGRGEPHAVLQTARFIAATRPEFDLGRLDLGRFGDRVSVIQIPALAISSTDIRRRVREGRPIHYLVPAEVASYIEERHLYEHAGD